MCNVYASMQYLKINTCKGLHILLCSALSMQTMLTKQSINIHATKQSINIHAKAYKVIAMQYKSISIKQYKIIKCVM